MRDSRNQMGFKKIGGADPGAPVREVPYDGRRFFESFYTANVEGEPKDHMTIGWITEPEAKFHYNAVENSIIRALLRRSPPPAGAMVAAWRRAMKQQESRLLDVGSGTGHWIDFMRETFHVKHCFGVELTEKMSAYLCRKYEGDPSIRVLQSDVSDVAFGPDLLGGEVDYVTAIGVMFHIVDDAAWERAVVNLARCLKPRGVLLVGDDVGVTTQNREVHGTDDFTSWREFNKARGASEEVRVGKRVRSLSTWVDVAGGAGLRLLDVIRTDREPVVTTPENDLIAFEKT